MKFKLVFNDWQDENFKSVYSTEEGVSLSMSNFHSGSTFNCNVELSESEIQDLKNAIKDGYRPIFELIPGQK